MDLRAYVTLEDRFVNHLLIDWHKRSYWLYEGIAQACRDHNYEKARILARQLDLSETGEANREWVKYALLSFAILGAKFVVKGKPSFVGVGTFDAFLNQVTSTTLQYLEFGATEQVQAQALQLIAEDEVEYLATKAEYSYGTTHAEVDPTSSAASTINAAREAIRDEDCAGDGKEVTPNHVTLRYGLLDADVVRLRTYIRGLHPFEVRITHLHIFDPSDNSDGAAPIVAKVVSPELHQIANEIEQYGNFKENSWPEYVPHITLAYVKPEAAKKYKKLYVDGSFLVRGITIGHRSGVRETIPFLGSLGSLGKTTKADKKGRFVTPFVSFDQLGDAQLQLIASLNASRLATWGFTAEAESRGVKRYRLTAVLDGRTSEFCKLIHGKVFEVEDAREKVIEALRVVDPNDLRQVQPWPKQTKDALKDFAAMPNYELKNLGLHIPPYHPYCRTVCELITNQNEKPELPTVLTMTPDLSASVATEEAFEEMGTAITPEQLYLWNAKVTRNPVEVLHQLFGWTPQEILSKQLGSAIVFTEQNTITLKAKGVMNNVRYSAGTVIDPLTSKYYLTHMDLVAAEAESEVLFARKFLKNAVAMGSQLGLEQFVVQAAGDAVAYVRLGFVLPQLEWDFLRKQKLSQLASKMALPLEESLVIQQLLGTSDPTVLRVLVDMGVEVEGQTLGDFLLSEYLGPLTLAVSNVTSRNLAETGLG